MSHGFGTGKKDGAIREYDLRSGKVRTVYVMIHVLCFLVFLACIFPAVWVMLAGFKDIREFTRNATIFPASFDLSKMQKTWELLKFTKYYKNSLILVAGGTVCAVFFNGLLAYGFAILKPKGYRIAYGLVMWSMMVPATTSMVSLFRNINLTGLNGSFVPLWLMYGANAFWVILFKEFFEGLPREVIDAARVDGCGSMQIFLRIVLPLSKPIIMVVAIFAVTAAWSEFLLPYLVLNGSGKETVMVKLFSFKDTPTDAVSVLRAAFFSIIPPTIIFILFQRQITDNAAAGAIKG